LDNKELNIIKMHGATTKTLKSISHFSHLFCQNQFSYYAPACTAYIQAVSSLQVSQPKSFKRDSNLKMECSDILSWYTSIRMGGLWARL